MNAMTEPLLFKQGGRELVSFATQPSNYQHWTLNVDGDVARLKLDINEDGGIKTGYKLKLNSYDLGVDIELHDAINRVRFEHPQVKVVVFESGKEKIWCSGANIYMLGLSSHAWKVNFCKFTNETRNGLEDSSRHDGLKSLAELAEIEGVAPSGRDEIRTGRKLADLELRQALGRKGAPQLTAAFPIGQDDSLIGALFAIDAPHAPDVVNSYASWLGRQEQRVVQG